MDICIRIIINIVTALYVGLLCITEEAFRDAYLQIYCRMFYQQPVAICCWIEEVKSRAPPKLWVLYGYISQGDSLLSNRLFYMKKEYKNETGY